MRKMRGDAALLRTHIPVRSFACKAAEEEVAAAEASKPTSPLFRAVTATLTTFAAGVIGGGTYLHYAYDIPTLAKDTDALYSQVAKAGAGADPMMKLKLEAMQKYLLAREWADKQYHHYADPSSERLLPDLPPGMNHIRTLVLDLDELLVFSDWTRERGWRTFKRPGVDVFLQHLAQRFEIVVYTDQLQTYVDPILERLDTKHSVHHRLYRDATQYVHGEHVRDLSKLNRPLTHVLYLSANEKSYSLQPSNAIQVPAWKKDASDRALLDMMPFLEAVARQCPPDMRDVVSSYTEESARTGESIPAIYRRRMSELQSKRSQQQASKLSGFGRRIGGGN